MGKPNGSPFSAIVSGLPLLNFPVARRQAFMADLISRLVPGAPLIQFSYGTQAPVCRRRASPSAAPPGLANIPPARVWVYRKV